MKVSVGHSSSLLLLPMVPGLTPWYFCYPPEAHQCSGCSAGETPVLFSSIVSSTPITGDTGKGSQEDGAIPFF